MATDSVYLYALIKSLYDQGEDYIDSFITFPLQVLESRQAEESLKDGFSDISAIQLDLKHKFELKMPFHVLENVLFKAKRREFVEQQGKSYKLVTNGFKYLESLETEGQVERRINSLVQDIITFFRENKVSLSEKQTKDLLFSLFLENIQPLIECINPSAADQLNIKDYKERERILIKYMQVAEQKKPAQYQTIQDILLGSIISVILYTRHASDMRQITKGFKKCQVFLDTNYVFSLLDLHTEEFSKPAKELLQLIKEHGFIIKVFEFTLDEISRVLSTYLDEYDHYPISIRVDSVSSHLKRKGWGKTQVVELLADLEDILSKEGITVEWGTSVDLENYELKTDGQLREALLKYKPYLAEYSPRNQLLIQNHDLAAIEKIQEYRRHPVRHIERCKCFFLSSDTGLSRFNYNAQGHKEKRTICEVILDRLLTNILWLKKPKSTPPIKSIIAAHSRNLFIRRRVWERFYEILRGLRRQDKINDGEISMLFYHGNIEHTLTQISATELDQITPEFVLSEIEKAAKLKEEETERIIKQKEAGFLKELKQIKKEKAKEAKKHLEKISSIKGNLRSQAWKSANNRVLGMRISVGVLLSIPLIHGYVTGEWDTYHRTMQVGQFIALGSGITLSKIDKLWKALAVKWSDKIYHHKRKEIGLKT